MKLNEVRTRVFTASNGDAVGYFTSKKRNATPFVVVFPKAGSTGDQFRVVSLTKAGRDIQKPLLMKRYRNRDEWTEDDDYIYDRFIEYGILQDTGKFSTLSRLFDVVDYQDRTNFFSDMMNKHGLFAAALEGKFGEMPELDSGFTLGGDIRVMMPPNANSKSIELTKGVLKQLDGILRPLGLHGLVAGNYRVSPIGGNTAARFEPATHWITLDMASLRNKDALRFVLHELGHKWDELSKLRKQIIEPKYYELRRDGHDFDIRVDVIPGDKLFYNGRGMKKLKGIPLEVTHTSRVTDTARISGVLHNGKTFGGKLPLRLLGTGEWTHLDGTPVKRTNIGSKWFPTKYSTTAPEEFFCELFAEYALGRADPEVVEWYESLPRP